MNRHLIIRTPNGDFDLFEDEDIVQTSAIFNLKDISSRSGEYTNEFNLPLTNNNRRIIEYADFVPSVNTLPYKKLSVEIIVDELPFKTGFIEITGIINTIQAKFYSGNSTFYDLIKSIYLNDLDWSDYDHVWNLTNAVTYSSSTTGFVYPVIDYNGQTLSGDIVDVRKILPSTYTLDTIGRILDQFGYTPVLNFNIEDLERALIPYCNKNPVITAAVQAANSIDGYTNSDWGISAYLNIPYQNIQQNYSVDFTANQFIQRVQVDLFTGTNGGWDLGNRRFVAQTSGVFNYSLFIDLLNYSPVQFQNVDPADFSSTSYPDLYFSYVATEVRIIKSNPSGGSSINSVTIVSGGNTISGSVLLNQGDEIYIEVNTYGNVTFKTIGGVNGSFDVYCDQTISDTVTLSIDLQPQLIFGGQINYSQMLPKMKCSDFLKDICIRFGLILYVDEDTKVITFNKIDKVTENIPLAKNWTNKLDETKKPNIQFKYDSYCQYNNFKHALDKTNTSIDAGSDYILTINNANLPSSKDFYTSPFAASQNVSFNGVTTTYINLYDVNTGNFDNDVVPRILFSKFISGQFKFTDGTTTSAYLDNVVCWFIDNDVPDLSMGFGGLMPKNSKTIINTLQNLRIIKTDFNLNIIDIKSMDYFIPVWVEQFQSYFFISSNNQFNYTRPQVTEVELIKLN